MGSRDRKRAERRKRKERSGDRREELAAQREERAARTEAKNQAAREALDPLEPDERPVIVTVAAVISAALALGTVVAYALGVEVGEIDDFGTETGEAKPNVFQTAVFTILLGAMAFGLWRARYWAVLGFQVLLGITLVYAGLSLLFPSNWQAFVLSLGVIAAAGTLFWFLIRAMARIQMPDRRRREQA